jgi:hypothetical protein
MMVQSHGRKQYLSALPSGHREVSANRISRTPKPGRVFGQRRKPAKMFRAGLYARVSTHDQQTLSLQLRAMREYAAKRGWEIALQIKEAKGRRAQSPWDNRASRQGAAPLGPGNRSASRLFAFIAASMPLVPASSMSLALPLAERRL